jgi:elongator complex protein 3
VSKDELVLYGFCRLRLVKKTEEQLSELKDCALVRELHVYSSLTPVHSKENNIQHKGFGKKLLKKAENIAKYNGYHKIAVISGVGVRNYYRKLGYKLHDTYMIKSFYSYYTILGLISLCIFMLLMSIVKKWI